MAKQHIVVIGAGVVGLSCAVCLQEAGYAVTIVARDFLGPFELVDPISQINFTSPWGGAHNRWVPPKASGEDEREHAMALATFAHMDALSKTNPEAGITFMKGIEYLEAPGAEYETLTEDRAAALGMEGFRILRQDELPDTKVKWGCEYRTWCVNTPVYCMFLLRRFVFRGGKILKKELREPIEVFVMSELGKVDAVVNASGNGFGDDKVYPTRGQTCVVSNLCDVTVTRQNADGSWTFCVPRNFEGGTIVGGTKEPDNWDISPSLEVREKLLQNFAATYPKILGESGQFRVIKDVVGRRPTRKGGLRLEGEKVAEGKFIMHAYGLGGRGYELSWGVAQNVLAGIQQHAATKSKL